MYKRYPQPWVIGYSGGKDSTTVLQLVWNAIKGLPPEERQKPIFVIASDYIADTPTATSGAVAAAQKYEIIEVLPVGIVPGGSHLRVLCRRLPGRKWLVAVEERLRC
jgi:3'-phosphoadenosine 5'-phosphosulfate sulfotransferase (PAPS reductase)/FAD synthetase